MQMPVYDINYKTEIGYPNLLAGVKISLSLSVTDTYGTAVVACLVEVCLVMYKIHVL